MARAIQKGENIWHLEGTELGLPHWELATTITMLPTIAKLYILQLILSYYHSPRLALDIFPFPVALEDIFLCPVTP